MEAGVSMTGVDILSKETQIQKYVPDCCSSRHKGPVDSSEEVDQMVEICKVVEKLLRSALCKEIRYRKYSPYSIKLNNPLFAQQKVDLQDTYRKSQAPVDEDGCVNGCKIDIIS